MNLREAVSAIVEGQAVLDVINALLEKIDVGQRTKHSVPGTSRLPTQKVGLSKSITKGAKVPGVSRLKGMKIKPPPAKLKISRGFY